MSRWRSNYKAEGSPINYDTAVVEYFSSLASNGDGTIENPYGNKNIIRRTEIDGLVYHLIVSNGINNLRLRPSYRIPQCGLSIVGQSKYDSVLNLTLVENSSLSGIKLSNVKLNSFFDEAKATTRGFYLYDSVLNFDFSNTWLEWGNSLQCYHTIINIYSVPKAYDTKVPVYTNCYIHAQTKGLNNRLIPNANNCLYEQCDLTINQNSLNSYKSNYHAFVGCRFKIGTETDYKALEGTTENELRNNFKARCEGQGFTVPNVTESGETLPMGCWVFANDGTVDGYILKGSIVADFQTRRGKTLGFSDKIVDALPISTAVNAPFSFNPNNPKGNKIILNNDSIALDGTVDISKMTDNSITSSVGMLSSQGLSQLTTFDVLNNFNVEAGVRLTSDRAFGDPVTKIESGANYLLRSSNDSLATVTYNGEQYTSSLADRKNIIQGVAGKLSLENPSSNAKVYPVTDLAQQTVMDVRIVKDLPSDKIKTGNLLNKCWYFVSSDNVNAPIGTVQYKGVDYSFGSSFLTDTSDLTFKIGGEAGNNLHLRRCWVEDYDPSKTDYVDYNFWKDKQQPQWVKVAMADLRCLMKDDNPASGVMRLGEDGRYIASGHPEFYNYSRGYSGYSHPGYPIAGKFCQIRLNISTYNAM